MADDNEFTVKDYDRMIDDIMDEYFEQRDTNFDSKAFDKEGLLSGNLRQRLGLGGPEDIVEGEIIRN